MAFLTPAPLNASLFLAKVKLRPKKVDNFLDKWRGEPPFRANTLSTALVKW